MKLDASALRRDNARLRRENSMLRRVNLELQRINHELYEALTHLLELLHAQRIELSAALRADIGRSRDILNRLRSEH